MEHEWTAGYEVRSMKYTDHRTSSKWNRLHSLALFLSDKHITACVCARATHLQVSNGTGTTIISCFVDAYEIWAI